MRGGPNEHLPYVEGEGGILLRVRAVPGAGRNAVCGLRCDAAGRMSLLVRVTAAAERGKANGAVIAALARVLGLAKSRLSIRSGDASHNKLVFIEGERGAIAQALDILLMNWSER